MCAPSSQLTVEKDVQEMDRRYYDSGKGEGERKKEGEREERLSRGRGSRSGELATSMREEDLEGCLAQREKLGIEGRESALIWPGRTNIRILALTAVNRSKRRLYQRPHCSTSSSYWLENVKSGLPLTS